MPTRPEALKRIGNRVYLLTKQNPHPFIRVFTRLYTMLRFRHFSSLSKEQSWLRGYLNEVVKEQLLEGHRREKNLNLCHWIGVVQKQSYRYQGWGNKIPYSAWTSDNQPHEKKLFLMSIIELNKCAQVRVSPIFLYEGEGSPNPDLQKRTEITENLFD